MECWECVRSRIRNKRTTAQRNCQSARPLGQQIGHHGGRLLEYERSNMIPRTKHAYGTVHSFWILQGTFSFGVTGWDRQNRSGISTLQ